MHTNAHYARGINYVTASRPKQNKNEIPLENNCV
jgi:hypothetical protein